MQLFDHLRRDLVRLAQLSGDPDGARNIFDHHGGLDRAFAAGADGEHAVVLEQAGRAGTDVFHHQLADILAADQAEPRAGDRPAKLVRLGGQVDRDGLADGGKGGGIGEWVWTTPNTSGRWR